MKSYQSSMPLFDKTTIEPVDPSVLDSDRPRLTSACYRVLARLKEGPATNLQLQHPDVGGSRFGARLGDLRATGVIWKREHVKGSVWSYRLISCPPEL